ncbi:MAG: hypothetical protein HQ567_25970 [Candidatus Nealsonbacteria bacterium]|nr:hypothetical protein [Candidatus Nealsonbacteria bacterium]
MKRLPILLMSTLLLAGCSAATDDKPAGQPAKNDRADDAEPQTKIVRALLDAIDEVDGEDEDVKDELRQSLRESDKELRKVLGSNSRRLIEQANKKPPAPMVVPATNRPAKGKPKKDEAVEDQAT